MRDDKKVFATLAVLIVLGLSACSVSVSGEKTGSGLNSQKQELTPTAVPAVDPFVMAQRLGHGVNLGNALDAWHEGEWTGGVLIQEDFFDKYKADGFDSVRIPVTWNLHLDTKPPYKVDPVFMARVNQVVDWALARNFAVVLNCHHEDWIRVNYPADQIPRFEALWAQIAAQFANKSENLVFEVMNEPNTGITADQVNDMNARALKVIRQTNPTRNVILGGRGWNSPTALMNEVIFPNDGHLIANSHFYDPYFFTLGGRDTNWGTQQEKSDMINTLTQLKQWSDQKKIPVYIGEYGAYSTNPAANLLWYQNFCKLVNQYGFATAAWLIILDVYTVRPEIVQTIIGPAKSSSSVTVSSSKSSALSSSSSSSVATGPAGYTHCVNEGQAYTFNQTVDVAYGANGKFNYKAGVTGTITFNNATFGDPIPGVVKKGYYKAAAVSSKSSSSSSSSSASLSTSSAPSSSSSKSVSSSSKSSVSSSIGTVTEVTIPFTKEGKGEFWYKVSQTPSYINSWNLDVLEVNGVSFLNVWVSGANLPAKQNGYYNIRYKASYDWSHFEVK